jgi:adenosylcobinamide-GDP ribazoletransferase
VPERRHADGLRLALTTFTVLPVRAGRVDRSAAGSAMVLAPVVGALLGLLVGAVVALSDRLDAPALVAGGLAVAVGALLTRGLHLDGLADTADGLGSYRRGAEALAVMRRPEVGAFGVVTLVVVLVLQAAALPALPQPLAGAATALATGRLAATWACRNGVPAARSDGLGALVAGTVGRPALAVVTVAVAALSVLAVEERRWQGPVAVVAGLGVALLLVRHAVRRFGGINGDVLGAAVEVATTVVLVALVLG